MLVSLKERKGISEFINPSPSTKLFMFVTLAKAPNGPPARIIYFSSSVSSLVWTFCTQLLCLVPSSAEAFWLFFFLFFFHQFLELLQLSCKKNLWGRWDYQCEPSAHTHTHIYIYGLVCAKLRSLVKDDSAFWRACTKLYFENKCRRLHFGFWNFSNDLGLQQMNPLTAYTLPYSGQSTQLRTCS